MCWRLITLILESQVTQAMDKRQTIAQIVALTDMILAVYVFGYLCNLFSQSVEIIPGSQSRKEKFTRLVVYAGLNFLGILTQFAMATKLLLSANKMNEDPNQAKRVFRWWGEWSVIFFLILVLDAAVLLILMEFGKRKLISLATCFGQVIFRLFGLIVISHIKISLGDQDGIYKV